MTNRWLEIQLAVPDRTVDVVSQILTELGCTGVTAAEKALDTFVVPSPDALANNPILRAYFPYPENLEELCKIIKDSLAELTFIYPELSTIHLEHRELADHDWASDWKQHFPPIEVGNRLVICPSWIEWHVKDQETVITLDPGQAFGTGTHATTSLCLDAIDEHFASAAPPKQILDVGTGSGILAMAGAALGAEHVTACDIDSDACKVAEDNIARNQLGEHITVTDRLLDEILGRFDLVLANILAAENIRLADQLIARLALGGRLVLSGILIDQEEQVIKAFSRFPLTLITITHRDEWTCIVYKNDE